MKRLTPEDLRRLQRAQKALQGLEGGARTVHNIEADRDDDREVDQHALGCLLEGMEALARHGYDLIHAVTGQEPDSPEAEEVPTDPGTDRVRHAINEVAKAAKIRGAGTRADNPGYRPDTQARVLVGTLNRADFVGIVLHAALLAQHGDAGRKALLDALLEVQE